ncbi:MAG: hypothetical protein AVDCRST_MAG34-1450 [uncultured Nocardioidaceae bacterium]|uniref:Uncharacterized protein n=1 Tax=uncultured Nocardioidaceae bacterium TaxID=253824 RepID=A0A6J4L2B9_9ACTN|nr:MAG: hypothetical protein AVDCRST_MAG34-1450 [uncultured Nocardioidaceae bacterium]
MRRSVDLLPVVTSQAADTSGYQRTQALPKSSSTGVGPAPRIADKAWLRAS